MPKIVLLTVITVLSAFSFALTGSGISENVALDNVDPGLSLIAPNGGETWAPETIQNILWSSTDTHFDPAPIDISFSVGEGVFQLIFNDTENDGSEAWTLPSLTSYMALVRIEARDHFGNTTQRQSAAYFTIAGILPQSPQGVTISITNNTDAFISWLPVTEDVNGNPFNVDHYLVYHAQEPGGGPEDFTLLGYTTSISYTHPNAVLEHPRSFYAVVAYSDPDGRLGALINSYDPNSGEEITLKNLPSLIHQNTGDQK